MWVVAVAFVLQGGLVACQLGLDPAPPQVRATAIPPTPTLSAATPSPTTEVVQPSATLPPTVAPTLTTPPTTLPTETAVAPMIAATPTIALVTPTFVPAPTLPPDPTAQPTLPPALALDGDVQVRMFEPVANMFLPTPVEVAGHVSNVASGQVRLNVYTPAGALLGLPPTLATTEVVTDGLRFRGTLPLGYAPTPRSLLVSAEYLGEDGAVRAFVQQPAQVLGRFAQVNFITVEAPLPYTRNADPTLIVRGAAPGPPKSVVVRMLDAQGQVLESVTAGLGWYQPGMACDFTAELQNNPAGTSIEVVSLGEFEAVMEQVRVPLGR